MIQIRRAGPADWETLKEWDRHIPAENLKKSLENGFVLIAEENGVLAGWLRYNLFWDSIPFLNLLLVVGRFRGRGVGRGLTEAWEKEMAKRNYAAVMTSTAADEYAQHFYDRLGYRTVGGFFPPEEGYELLLEKRLNMEDKNHVCR